ncbi:MAG: SEC-C domain-containing protein [Thermodesulfobacteriota bacterium]
MRTAEQVISDIKNLIYTKGYIYALCMILFEDFHIDPEKMHEMDNLQRLSVKEASLLLGFLVQKKIDFATPDLPFDLINMKQKTYELMEELHTSFMIPFLEKMEKSFTEDHKEKNFRKDQKEFFGKGDMFVESIFYSGTGVYDFQYLDFLERKYKYDKHWLSDNKNFNIKQTQSTVRRIKQVLHEKSKKVNLYATKERTPQLIEKLKKKDPDQDWDKIAKETLPMMEIHQYVDLFFDYKVEGELTKEELREKGWEAFYKGLIELFVIRKSDFDDVPDIDSFLSNLSFSVGTGCNHQFQMVGNYNVFNSHPLIKLDEERYLVPIVFLLFEAVYEAPFYWMWLEDKSYRDQLAENRGNVGEEIVYEFLIKTFGIQRTFKSVKINTGKGHDVTDIDAFCVLGSKALCVQVKSKKLTELSRTGDDEQLQKDFQGAVQDAYKQGLVSRHEVLKRSSEFFDENGHKITLPEDINEVYIMVITTENYPSLTHQAHIMLDKKEDDPFPIVLTVFDLELIVDYLKDPYDFLYYIKLRTLLMDYFRADEEIVYLGYHLDRKLWKSPNTNFFVIDSSYGQLIDRNYYPKKAGLDVSDEGDAIKNRWKNEGFDKLCDRLKTLNEPKITDIIFHLLDWSGDARKNLVDYLIKTKKQTLKDGNPHDFSIPPDESYSLRVGITYYSLNSGSVRDLQKRLLMLCQARKYKSKGDVWIGFGSLNNSHEMIDAVVFNEQNWEYDKELETMSKALLGGGKGRLTRIGRKIGRNERCRCGSGLKHKKCCGLNK